MSDHDAATTPNRVSLPRILIVDDDMEATQAYRAVLRAKGYEVLLARDGNEGLAMYDVERPDLLVLDMMMPKRSGFLVLETIRKADNDAPPVIMITANEGKRHRDYAELLGVEAYLIKPFPVDALLAEIERVLQRRAKS
jgi:DNA-binding response OmpR family regulator